MIGLIVLGLAFLFFIVVAFFAAKTWHVGHVVAMVFLFLFTLVFLFLTSTLLRTHNKFRPAYAQAVKGLEEQQQRKLSLTYGNPSGPAGADSLVGERTLARVEQVTSGRIWGNVRGSVRPGAPIQLDMRRWSNDGCARVGQEDDISEDVEPVPDEDASGATDGAGDAVVDGGGGGVGNPHGIRKDQFVYAFKVFPISMMTPAEKEYYFAGLGEGEDSFPNKDKKGFCRVPIAYLGKFQVLDSQPAALSVVPTGALSPGQQQQLTNNAPWVLYEELPMDSHDLFKGVDPDKLPGLIPMQRLTQTGLRIPQAAYQNMMSEYARDGKEYTDRVNSPFRLNVQVKFLREYEEVVDLVVEAELPPTDRPFNVEGRAQMTSLLQGEPTKFAKDDVATFDQATANRLAQQGIAEPVGTPTYVRQLRDFEFALDDYQGRFNEVDSVRQSVQNHVNDLAASLKRLQEQIDKHREESDLLREDQQGFEAEKSQLQRYLDLLRRRFESLDGEVERLNIARLRSEPLASF